MKDVLYRGLDSRNKSLSDSIKLEVSVVNFIEEQRGDGATSIKQLSDDHLEVANKALGRIRKLDKTFKRTSNNEDMPGQLTNFTEIEKCMTKLI